MKRLFDLLSATKQKSSDDHLIAFLNQCHSKGVHLRLATLSGEHQLKALIKPLNLSRKNAKAVLKSLIPLSTFTLEPYEFFTSMNHQDQQAFPCQVCDSCAPGLFEHYGYDVADTGWCSQCHQRGECLDVPLIEHYRKYGIDDETIWRHLPRKRWGNGIYPPRLLYKSIEDIEAEHQSIFDAFEKRGATCQRKPS